MQIFVEIVRGWKLVIKKGEILRSREGINIWPDLRLDLGKNDSALPE
jgi:hypothetical protein